jgi:DNA-binding IclR family transcriptional regulator
MPKTKPALSRTRPPAAEPPAEKDPLYVTALARGLSILKCCGEAGADLSVSEIAKLLGLPQSTVWRSCYTLVQHGYLVRVDNDRLRPGLAVLGLGYAALSRHSLAEVARPGMETIAKRFPGAVSLGVPQGLDMLYLARVEGGPPIYPGLRVGSRVGVLGSAMGWAWLAALPVRRRNEFLAKARTQAKDQYERIADQLADAIRFYEKHGLLVNSGVIHPELNAIAVPIGAEPDQPVASLSFGGVLADFPAQRLLDEVAPRLMEVAAGLCASVRAAGSRT